MTNLLQSLERASLILETMHDPHFYIGPFAQEDKARVSHFVHLFFTFLPILRLKSWTTLDLRSGKGLCSTQNEETEEMQQACHFTMDGRRLKFAHNTFFRAMCARTVYVESSCNGFVHWTRALCKTIICIHFQSTNTHARAGRNALVNEQQAITS